MAYILLTGIGGRKRERESKIEPKRHLRYNGIIYARAIGKINSGRKYAKRYSRPDSQPRKKRSAAHHSPEALRVYLPRIAPQVMPGYGYGVGVHPTRHIGTTQHGGHGGACRAQRLRGRGQRG